MSDYSVPSTFTLPNPSQTASLDTTYIPPFAKPTSTISKDFPTSSTSVFNPNPSTPPLQDDQQWITAYLTIHKLSSPSYRYTYLFWLSFAFACLILAILHCTGARRGAFVAFWNKWGLRRITWRKQRPGGKHRQPIPLPSNAQLLSLFVLFAVTMVLCFVGPDYISPSTSTWDLTHNVTARAVGNSLVNRAGIPTTATTSSPGYTIPKAWWTSGGRTGTMAFALFPLCVLFALKAPPVALLALPFTVQLFNDKLAFLHRWSGRLVWFVTALHITLWGVQLGNDKRGKDNPSSAWSFAFDYDKFVYGWLGFICLTLLVALSLRPVRMEFYELFYLLHILLVPLSLAFSALHFPPTAWWCWGALILWGAERLWRFVKFARVNGWLGGMRGRRKERYMKHNKERPFSTFRGVFSQAPAFSHVRGRSSATDATQSTGEQEVDVTEDDSRWNKRPQSTGQETLKSFRTTSSAPLMASSPGYSLTPTPIHPGFPSQSRMAGYSSRGTYLAPPGYAHATLLPGRTIRLRLIPPHHFTWAPGQHVLLTIPAIARFNSHPFTVASVCDQDAPKDDARELVLLIRARSGFTKHLWKYVEKLENEGKIGAQPTIEFTPPRRGVLLRAFIDGPYGSSARVRWTTYSTLLIVAGGSGIAFGTSILEYACLCLSGRNGKTLGGKIGGLFGHDGLSQIRRVRLVWIVREFSHMQWAASILRRCLDLVRTNALQIDIFVTNVPEKRKPAYPLTDSKMDSSTTYLVPPNAQFMKNEGPSNPSEVSLGSNFTTNSDLESQVTEIVDMYGGLGFEEHVLDLTNFDGEDDTRMPGESQLNQRLRTEGKIRREKTRQERESLRLQIPRGSSPHSHDQLSPIYEPYSPNTPHSSDPLRPAYPPKSPISPIISPLSPLPSGLPHSPSGLEQKFDMDEVEAEDMPIIAERARPGRPKIDAIIAEEARRSQGPLVVASCGPSALNAVVRKSITSLLDPAAIFRRQAHTIDLVSEEFEW